MLTRYHLEAMSDQDRVDLFDRLQAKVYGGTTHTANVAMALDLNIHPNTPYKWRKVPSSLPWAVLYALDAMSMTQDAMREQAGRRIATALADVAAMHRAAADRLARL